MHDEEDAQTQLHSLDEARLAPGPSDDTTTVVAVCHSPGVPVNGEGIAISQALLPALGLKGC